MNNNYNGYNGDYGNSGYPRQTYGNDPYQQQYNQPAYQQPVQPQYSQPAYQQPMQPQYNQPVYQAPPVDPGKNTGIASLILGIISLLFFSGLIGLGCSIAGIITGTKSKKASIEAGLQASGLAKGGFICSVIGLVLAIISTLIKIFIIVLYFIGMMGTATYNY